MPFSISLVGGAPSLSKMAYTVSVTSPKLHLHYQDNKERAYNSTVKSLLYGGDEIPQGTKREGKRSVAHPGQSTIAPFATVDSESFQRDFHPTQRKKDGAAKVNTGGGFDSEVYRQQIADNYYNMQASKARAYGGNGVFSTH